MRRIRSRAAHASAGVRPRGRPPFPAALLALASLPGCLLPTPDPGIPLPPTEAERAAFGTVGVTGPADGHVVRLVSPEGGAAFGLERGARAGVATSVAADAALIGGVIAGSEAVLALSAGATFGVVLLPALAVTLIVCHASAASGADVTRVAAAVLGAVGDAATSGDLTDAFVAAARSEAGVAGTPPESAVTRIEVAIESAEFRPGGSPQRGGHGLVLSVTGRARVVRAADGAAVHDLRLTAWAHAPPLEWDGWSDPGGAPARDVVRFVLRRLAVALVEEIFLVDRTLVDTRRIGP